MGYLYLYFFNPSQTSRLSQPETTVTYEAKVCRYSWHSAGSLGWPFPMLKYEYIFSNGTYESSFIELHSETVMAWLQITRMLIAV